MKQSKNELNETAPVHVRHRFQRKAQQLVFTKPSMAKQSMKDECDINNILRQYQKTGVLNFTNKRSPQYGDFPSYDLKEAMQVVQQANEMFADMPAALRDRFGNSPENFLEFIQDTKNRQEAEALGLIAPEKMSAKADNQQAGKPADKSPPGSKTGEASA